MSWDACTGCALCVAGCAAFRTTGNEATTAMGWMLARQEGHLPAALGPLLEPCHQTNQCVAACPEEIDLRLWFTRWRREAPAREVAAWSHRWDDAGNLVGRPLLAIEARPGDVTLLLGCDLRSRGSEAIGLVARALDRAELDWGWPAEEPCCGGFLEEGGVSWRPASSSREGMPRPYTGEAPIASLDGGCAAALPRSLSLWDVLLDRPDLFRGLEGQVLRVGARWFNADPGMRQARVQAFCEATGCVWGDLTLTGALPGDDREDWRVRVGLHPATGDRRDGQVVLEPAHRTPDNHWLLEFLL